MLVLSRKVGESFMIGDQVRVTVVRIAQGGVRIGIEAPGDATVLRSELVEPSVRAPQGRYVARSSQSPVDC